MCGIIGIISNTPIAYNLINSLKSLQHRGQQAAGCITMDQNTISIKKGLGLIKEVINESNMSALIGNVGIGHVRYPTAGVADDPEQVQPFYVNSPFGIILAHNGNLTNSRQLRVDLRKTDHRHIRTNSDSEILTNIFASELENLTLKHNISNQHIFQAITNVNQRINGGYAVVGMIVNYGLIAFRDPHGIRPLVIGTKIVGNHPTYFIASETCAIDAYECDSIRDIQPGEVVIIKLNGELESKICHTTTSLNICLFEFVYLSRPDSIIEKASVQLVRQYMGKYLAKNIQQYNLDIDVVIAIPDTSRSIAIEVANCLNKPYREGFVKNHFTGRTFMLANQEQRNIAIRSKLSPIALEFKNKNILLVDDSIVRGTTSKQIIEIVRKCGAKKVYLASAAPEVRFPNIYGIDMPTHTELIAYQKDLTQISQIIGADKIIFQSLSDLKQAVTDTNPNLTQFDASCFDGIYVTQQAQA